MARKEGQKERRVRGYVFICKMGELTSRLQEEILKERLIKALRIDY